MKNRKISIILTIVVSIFLVAILALMINLDNIFTPEAKKAGSAIDVEKDMHTVIIDGERYLQNDNINIMFMYIYEYENTSSIDHSPYNINLLSFNTEKETFFNFTIDPTTITNVNEYNKVGQVINVKEDMIAKAYNYGNRMAQGCYNVSTSVKDLLYGLKFNQYVCLDYECIKSILDYVGEIEIEFPENITEKINSENFAMYLRLHASLVLKALIDKLKDTTLFSVDSSYELLESIYDKLLTNCNEYTLRKVVRVLHNYLYEECYTIQGSYNNSHEKLDLPYFEPIIEELKSEVKALFYEKRED